MLVLCIILALLVLLMMTKVGISLYREEAAFALKLKIGPLFFQILPRKKPKREKKEKAPRGEPSSAVSEKKEKPKLTRSDYLELIQMGLRALGRFRRALYVDVFHLRFVAGFDDPYNTAMSCAYAHAVIGILSPLCHNAFRVGESRVEIIPDFEIQKPDISGKLIMSLRVGHILRIAICMAVEYYRYMRRKKKACLTQTDRAPEPDGQAAAE